MLGYGVGFAFLLRKYPSLSGSFRTHWQNKTCRVLGLKRTKGGGGVGTMQGTRPARGIKMAAIVEWISDRESLSSFWKALHSASTCVSEWLVCRQGVLGRLGF